MFKNIPRDESIEFGSQMSKAISERAPYFFNMRDEAPERSEDPVIILTQQQDFQTNVMIADVVDGNLKTNLSKPVLERLRTLIYAEKADVLRHIASRKEPELTKAINRDEKLASEFQFRMFSDLESKNRVMGIESAIVSILSLSGASIYKLDFSNFERFYAKIHRQGRFGYNLRAVELTKFRHGCITFREVKERNGFVATLYLRFLEEILYKTEGASGRKWAELLKTVTADDMPVSRYPGMLSYIFAHAIVVVKTKDFGTPAGKHKAVEERERRSPSRAFERSIDNRSIRRRSRSRERRDDRSTNSSDERSRTRRSNTVSERFKPSDSRLASSDNGIAATTSVRSVSLSPKRRSNNINNDSVNKNNKYRIPEDAPDDYLVMYDSDEVDFQEEPQEVEIRYPSIPNTPADPMVNKRSREEFEAEHENTEMDEEFVRDTKRLKLDDSPQSPVKMESDDNNITELPDETGRVVEDDDDLFGDIELE